MCGVLSGTDFRLSISRWTAHRVRWPNDEPQLCRSSSAVAADEMRGKASLFVSMADNILLRGRHSQIRHVLVWTPEQPNYP